MNLKKILSHCRLSMLGLILFSPTISFAQLLSITPTIPFPSQVTTSGTATGTFTVTNISSRLSLIAVDKSRFPATVSIVSSTCGNLMAPGQSCVIQLQLHAPTTPQRISFILHERAKPSADGVQLPISVRVVQSARLWDANAIAFIYN